MFLQRPLETAENLILGTGWPAKVTPFSFAKLIVSAAIPRQTGDTQSVMQASALRQGMVIKWNNNDLYSILKMEHRTPGNLRAFVQVKMRNLRTGAMFDNRFSSTEQVDRAILDEQEMEFLYDSNGESYTFMNTETYDQAELSHGTPRRRR